MKKLLNILLIGASFTSLALADGYKIEVAKTLDSNAKQQYFPDLILPIEWSDSLSSSIEYRSGELTDERVETGTTIDESMKHQRLKLNALNYSFLQENASYSLGLGLAYENYDKEQTGAYNDVTLGTGNYTNDIQIDYLTFYVKAQTIQKFSFIDLKAYALLIPIAQLDVKQNTSLTGNTVATITDDSSGTQDFSYELDLNLVSKSDTFVDLGVGVNYRILPLKYSLNGNNVDYEESIVKLQATLLFNIEILNGWMPSLSYSSETTSSNTQESAIEDNTEEKVYLGMQTRF